MEQNYSHFADNVFRCIPFNIIYFILQMAQVQKQNWDQNVQLIKDISPKDTPSSKPKLLTLNTSLYLYVLVEFYHSVMK